MPAFSNLLSPTKLGSVALRNRVVMASLTRDRSIPTNVPNRLNLEYYEQRAKGGAGLIMTEGTLISQQGTEWQNAPGIWSSEHVAGWKKITDAVHVHGAKIFCQLWHVGRVAHPKASEQIKSGLPVYAPSAISARGGTFRFLPGKPGYVTPTEVPDPNILIEQYRQAAINAKQAGFDGVELHSANGYLVNQFLDKNSNRRTDKWGGSYINRCRFGLEALKAIIEVWSADKVGIKINPTGGYNDVGMSLDDTLETFSHYIKEVDDMGLAYISLVRYTPKMDAEYDGKKRGTKHDVLESYSPLIKRAAIILNADLTPDEAEKLISEGKICAAMFGMPWIGNPDLVERLRRGKPLNQDLDFHTLYGGGLPKNEEVMKKGYTDYPFATEGV
ncbi:hypothetical protein EW145_g4978 [Phellinidium pouzarii]|uniref:NADH:flavin oxidoreductase/NADH oxidase N-terminal domain-containing protein n=1 Tax=Phellinidium pouzarii TaxID=167371 RepID=A0A4V3XCB8_9AGAM|nr:hypothetical protein EW145_g4978 [Phellinidium pouzarii]